MRRPRPPGDHGNSSISLLSLAAASVLFLPLIPLVSSQETSQPKPYLQIQPDPVPALQRIETHDDPLDEWSAVTTLATPPLATPSFFYLPT